MQKDTARSLGKQPRAIKQESGLLTTTAISRQACEGSAGWGKGGGLFPQRICLTQTSFPCSMGTRCVHFPPTPRWVSQASQLQVSSFRLGCKRKDCDSSRFLSARSASTTIPRHTRSLYQTAFRAKTPCNLQETTTPPSPRKGKSKPHGCSLVPAPDVLRLFRPP